MVKPHKPRSKNFSSLFSWFWLLIYLHRFPLLRVLHWQPNAGSTVNSQILNEVSQCVESIHGVKGGKWKATLTFYKPILRGNRPVFLQTFFGIWLPKWILNLSTDQNLPAAEFPRDFLGISLPEQPNKYYLIIRGQRIVLEADFTIQAIMEKLQSYKLRVALNFEVDHSTSLVLMYSASIPCPEIRIWSWFLWLSSLCSFALFVDKSLITGSSHYWFLRGSSIS